jgi:tetratricopeptide (TPR) repeat protein
MTTLENIGKKYGIIFDNDDYLGYENIIIKIFENTTNDTILQYNFTDPKICNILGVYYLKKNKYDEMIKYYLMGIELNYSVSMYNLGLYYYEKNKYVEMEKYYLMAIELKNTLAMIDLGHYYEYHKIDVINAKKYYMMAIELNNKKALEKYEIMHKKKITYKNDLKKKLDELNKEYINVTDKCDIFRTYDNSDIFNKILKYYYENKSIALDELYFEAIKMENIENLIMLATFYLENKDYIKMEQICLKLIELNNSKGYYTMATYYGHINEYNKMEEYLIKGKELDNTN